MMFYVELKKNWKNQFNLIGAKMLNKEKVDRKGLLSKNY